jgi:hypothetical protein
VQVLKRVYRQLPEEFHLSVPMKDGSTFTIIMGKDRLADPRVVEGLERAAELIELGLKVDAGMAVYPSASAN